VQFADRVLACFQGLATGDAIGKQTETLSHADVQKWYPAGITGFHGRPGDIIPRYAGKRYEWRIGETTDDTEQTIAVARALLETGRADHTAIGRELLKCKKSAHPGVSLWNFLQAGDPARIAPDGDGCGAAMRVAAIGVIYPSGSLNDLVRAAYECAIPTHGGPLAIAAAAAVAAAISAALEARSVAEILAVALQASQGPIAKSIEQVCSDFRGRPLTVDEIAERWFPDTPLTIVPLAIALGLITESAAQTILLAANVGGDADSVASIGGAIAGALRPDTVNAAWTDIVTRINGHELMDLAAPLAALRLQKLRTLPPPSRISH
jgi:ADP-ribosylglycohydrolase